MQDLVFSLPFPPSLNDVYAGNGRRYKSKSYKRWLEIVPKLEPLWIKSCTIHYKIYFPDKRVRDSKNFLKLVDDYLVSQNVLIDDDWTTLRHEIIEPCGIDRENPRIEIYLS